MHDQHEGNSVIFRGKLVMMRWFSAVFIGLSVMVSVAGAAGIQIADATIDPAPDQQITVVATGVDAVVGLNLYLEVTQSDLAITGIEFLDGTIWENNNEGQDRWVYPEANLPTAGWAFGMVIAHVGTVSTPGTLARLTVDATGLDGQTATITANTSEVASDFAGTPADAFVDGTITIRDNTPANEAPTVDAGPDQATPDGSGVDDNTADDPDANEPSDDDTQVPGDSGDSDSTDQSGNTQDTGVSDPPANTTDNSTSGSSSSQEGNDATPAAQQDTIRPVSVCGSGLAEAWGLAGVGLAFASARRRGRLISWR